MFCGVDPGLSGAIAIWRPGPDILEIHDMPTLRLKPGSAKRTLDAVELARVIDNAISGLKTFALIELAGTRPNEGLSAAHTNGRNWGTAYGILVAQMITVEIVPPATWKRVMGCTAAKDSSLARAKQMMPGHAEHFALRKQDNAQQRAEGRAEAALIARYAERRFRQREMTP